MHFTNSLDKDTQSTPEEVTEDLQFAENTTLSNEEYPIKAIDYEEKRNLLDKTKIVKQSWSIVEIYQKIMSKKLILDPQYQRNSVWNTSKKVAFIESLFMGIVIPPIYVVEIPNENVLEGNNYEVVDGKQRLSTITSFLENKLKLNAKYLEYYSDIYGTKVFNEIRKHYGEHVNEFLSSVLDVYVITANSPEFTKYDIFARLNKGSEKLKVNEIRKAIYRSKTLEVIEGYVNQNFKKPFYEKLFTPNDIKRYDDYGRFFKSIAYCLKVDVASGVVKNYNSRPRDMINSVLAQFQNNTSLLDENSILKIIEKTLKLKEIFMSLPNTEYLIDSCIYFAVNSDEVFFEKVNVITSDNIILETFKRSPTTTTNVNKRISRILSILNE
ncbi:DUF262 domain-containing protein [Clostridium sp. 'deep sea']|uniref:DUF262 domain-containing protein n=1 Tax=Clostridium sp. 'deep sea' TaxID=2779445 RepID=UPI0018966D64|nr:DUF262 domain-containing protein [Clostridium sp. 'deep sea']QOR33858.1 DUF262 domain-containing protein [Clostridium sp. 'deep sea']